MTIILQATVAAGTGKRKAAEGLAHLASVTQCLISADFEEVKMIVSPGQMPDDIEHNIDSQRAQVQAWRQHQEQKHGPKT